MGIFDTLAENRYQQWLIDQQAADYNPPAIKKKTARRLSFEGHLYRELMTLLEKTADTRNPQKRAEMMTQARAIRTQLILSLEKQQLPLASQTLQRSIQLLWQAAEAGPAGQFVGTKAAQPTLETVLMDYRGRRG